MALGIIPGVGVEGILEFAPVVKREGGATDLEELVPSQGSTNTGRAVGPVRSRAVGIFPWKRHCQALDPDQEA